MELSWKSIACPPPLFHNLVKREETGSHYVAPVGLKFMTLELSGAGITSVCYYIQLGASHSTKPHFYETWQGEEKHGNKLYGTVAEQHPNSTLLPVSRPLATHLLASLCSADVVKVTYSKSD